MMFSATFPKDARTLAKEYMATDHIRIRVGRAGSTHVNVEQNVSDHVKMWLSVLTTKGCLRR